MEITFLEKPEMSCPATRPFFLGLPNGSLKAWARAKASAQTKPPQEQSFIRNIQTEVCCLVFWFIYVLIVVWLFNLHV